MYLRARALADREKRKLVVIGNPTGGWINKIHQINGCGDVCIDMMGCQKCPLFEDEVKPRIFEGDVLNGLKTVEDDSAVVFECELFDYVADFPAVLKELSRITGGSIKRSFHVHTIGVGGPQNSWDYYTRGKKPPRPSENRLRNRREDSTNYAKTGEGLAVRIIYQWPPRDPFAWVELY
jgi:hypothetical protein